MRRTAFSLIEMAVVITVIGLIVGGVLLGKNMLRSASVMTVGREINTYLGAVKQFRDQYNALPGDMRNATNFWGIAAGTGSDFTCGDFVSTNQATCNGNGNQQIQSSTAFQIVFPVGIQLVTTITRPYEYLRLWQHLSNAGLIEGKYTGTVYATSGGMVSIYLRSGVNVPQSQGISHISYAFGYFNYVYAGAPALNAGFLTPTGNYMVMGGFTATYDRPSMDFLTPQEAYSLDKKYDDGIPGRGKWFSKSSLVFGNPQRCDLGASQTDYDAAYNLEVNELRCSFFIQL